MMEDRRASLVLNWILGEFGIIGLGACIATKQFGPMLSMLFYVFPPFLNIGQGLNRYILDFGRFFRVHFLFTWQ